MSGARHIIEDKKASSWKSWLRGMLGHSQEYAYLGYIMARHLAWAVITVGMITAVPMLVEVKREMVLEELEALQVSVALKEGASPGQLAQSGLASAIDPKVVK